MGWLKQPNRASLLSILKDGDELTTKTLTKVLDGVLFKSEFKQAATGSTVDHGELHGLTDDDHKKYLLTSDATSRTAFATNWGDLTDSGATTLHTHTNSIHVDVAGEIQGIGTVASAIDEDSVFVFEKADDSWEKGVVEFDVLSNLLLASAAPGYSSTVPIVTILADGTSAVVTVTLPDAATSLGYIYTVKAINVDNAVTLAPGGADTIDGSSSSIGLALMQSISVQSDGSNWWILDVLDHLRMANIGTNTHAQIDSHIADVLTNPHSVIASQVNFDAISGGGATYVSVQDFLNQAWSSGVISGFAMTEGASYAVDVAAGTATIASDDDENARIIYPFNFAGASSAAIADGTTRYVAIEYNGGTPQIVLSATSNLSRYDAFPLGWVTREGTTLHITNAPQHVVGIPHRIGHTLREVWGFRRADRLGGLVIGNTGTRNPTISAGEMYLGLNEFEVSAVDCSAAGTFSRYYRVAGVWTREDSLQTWPNTLYTDGSDLQTMTVNRYGNVWWYLDPEGGELIMLYGTSNAASQSTAEAEAPPATVPLRVSDGCVLIGRFVYQASGAAPVLVQSAFNAAFNAAGVSDHLALANIGTNTHAQIDTFISTTVPNAYLRIDGTKALSANWDAGSFKITAETLASDVATGTAPLTVASTTAVTNLNADLLDGNHAAAFATAASLASYLPLAGGTMTGNIDLDDTVLQGTYGGTQYDIASVSSAGAQIKIGDTDAVLAIYGSGARPTYYSGLGWSAGFVFETDLVSYLPKTAGSSQAITGDLYVQTGISIGDSTPGAPSGPLQIKDTAASDLIRQMDGAPVTSPQTVMTFRTEGTRVQGNGAGPAFAFAGDDSAGNPEFMGRVAAYWRDSTNGSEDAGIVVMGRNSGGGIFGLDIQAKFFDGMCNLKAPSSAPADADLETSSVIFWFDGSGGTKYLKVKHKDSGGTVRSGTVATLA